MVRLRSQQSSPKRARTTTCLSCNWLNILTFYTILVAEVRSILTLGCVQSLRRKNFKTQQSLIILDFCLKKKMWQENHIFTATPSFPKTLFITCFPSTRKRKACVFKFFQFEERLRNASFSWRISVDDKPNRRNKATFSHSWGLVWTGP